MNKKILGALFAFLLIISQSLCIFAAPSPQLPTNGGNYGDDFTDVIKDANALKVIDYINNNNPSNEDAINTLNDYTSLSLVSGILLTDFYKLIDLETTSDGMYSFTLEVLNLPDSVDISDINGIAFSDATQKWDIITPIALDNKTLTFKTASTPSAVAIYLPEVAEITSPMIPGEEVTDEEISDSSEVDSETITTEPTEEITTEPSDTTEISPALPVDVDDLSDGAGKTSHILYMLAFLVLIIIAIVIRKKAKKE